MKTIVVDDEESALEVFRYEARGIDELDIVYMSSDSEAALEYVGKNKADLAILDVDMQSMDGISLGNAILQKVPDIILIYITGYEKYAIDAVKLHAAGFILNFCQEGVRKKFLQGHLDILIYLLIINQ